jgi:thymidylate synthase
MSDTLDFGVIARPRGKTTKEMLHHTICVDMRKSVVLIPERKLNYRFMTAEAHWILTGDNKVSSIEPYNKHIAQFSDDGLTFFGAYGPKIMGQMPYVVEKLMSDPMTRQAGLTIWRESPPETKDYPCTISMFFSLRNWRLNNHVFMRSSDQWLGIPYDIFNFSCVGYMVCAYLNSMNNEDTEIKPGALYITAASSHLYEQNWAGAYDMFKAPEVDNDLTVPRGWYTDRRILLKALAELREPGNPLNSHRWWER